MHLLTGPYGPFCSPCAQQQVLHASGRRVGLERTSAKVLLRSEGANSIYSAGLTHMDPEQLTWTPKGNLSFRVPSDPGSYEFSGVYSISCMQVCQVPRKVRFAFRARKLGRVC